MHAPVVRFIAAAALLAASAATAPASAITVTPGLLPYEEELAAARFRKFNDPPGFELMVGVHAPTPAAGRDATWDLSAPHSVTFTHAPMADTLSAGVANAKPGSPFHQTFVNSALAAVPPAVSGDFVPADMNVMVITLTLESAMPVASTLSFEGVTLDGNPLSDCCSATCQFEGAGSVCPDDGSPCSSDLCVGAGACVHAAANPGVVCRATAGVCDVAETCSGVSPTCPTNGFQPNGTACGGGSVCTTVDQCNAGTCVGGAPLACDDGSACTVDTCDPVDGCASTGAGPAPGCRTASKSLLVVNQSANDAKDKLIWRWIKGASTDLAEIADPIGEADYSLCL